MGCGKEIAPGTSKTPGMEHKKQRQNRERYTRI
jgi:hypothetical protein